MKKRSLEGVLDNFGASIFFFKLVSEIDESNATTGNDTFIESCLGGGNGIINAILLFVDLSFSSTTNFNNGNLAREGSSAFFVLFTIVIRGSEVGLGLNEFNTIRDGGLFACSANNCRTVLGGDDLLGCT